jgi:signal transduction histidine kinase
MVLQHYEKENVYTERDLKFLTSIAGQIAISIERKIAEEEIRQKNELLQLTNAEKDKFFSIIAHDLRGPISAFVSVTEILTDDIQSMSPDEIRDIMASMKYDASNIYKLLENLLEWSRLKRGVMEFSPVKIQLLKIITSAVESISLSANAKNILVDLSIPDDMEVIADVHMIETVARNLLSNAVKFTHEGGKITVSAVKGKYSDAEISISDSGIGMPPDLISKLFQISEKTSRLGTAGEPSSGLGLLLCKEFVEKHGGKISVESSQGKGSIFTFTLKVR